MNIIQKNNISFAIVDLSANKDLIKNLEYKYKSNSIFEYNYMIEYWKVRHSLDGEILYDLKNSIIQSIIKKYYNKDTL